MVKLDLVELIQEHQLKSLDLQLHPFVATYLRKGFNSEERKWRRELACKIKIHAVDDLHYMEYKVFGPDGKELQRKRR
jgi:ribonuclease G